MRNYAQILAHYGIESREHDAPITKKAIGVCCPFCEDTGFHLGVFRDFGNFSCWRCGAKGSFYRLLHTLVGIGYEEYAEAIGSEAPVYVGDPERTIREMLTDEPLVRKDATTPVPMPGGAIPALEAPRRFLKALANFLNKRRYRTDDLIDRRCWFVARIAGPYAMRLIIPVFDGTGHYMGWQGRDVTGRAKLKYETPHGFRIKEYLYGAEHPACHDTAVVVEGILDAWRVGPGALATFGAQLAETQQLALVRMNPKRLIVAWDGDKAAEAERLAERLAQFLPDVQWARLPEGEDPDSLGDDVWKYLDEARRIE